MNKIRVKSLILCCIIVFTGSLSSCSSPDKNYDAYGNLEAIEIIVSSQGNGEIEAMNIEEGNKLFKGQELGLIDTIPLHLQKIQVRQSVKAIYAKLPNIVDQINVLKEKLAKAELEQNRIKDLFKSDAATSKQLDDVNSEVKVIKKQIVATSSSLNTQQKGLIAEATALEAQIKLLDYKISKSIIISPINGVVLTKYAYAGEVTSAGKPLFKMANLDSLLCRAYVSETQLNKIKIGGYANILVDASKDSENKYKGRITWISDKAEFTPKVIQTKEQRTNLVYAIKILVPNDGSLKIGMPARVKFSEK
ncbi:MAG: HlyD family efflux transporter periplasmic adaptor subunit [Bacteroidales bacterium]